MSYPILKSTLEEQESFFSSPPHPTIHAASSIVVLQQRPAESELVSCR